MTTSCNTNQITNVSQVVVYYAQIPQGEFALDLPTAERNTEIASCTSVKLQRQKYFVWKLLLDAIAKNYGTTPNFVKHPTGKWTCDVCSFSLSHSGDVVAVSISDNDTGIDVQGVALPKNNKVVDRVFSLEQAQTYHQIDSLQEKALYFTQTWTQKESIFKLLNQGQFLASCPQNYTQHTASKVVKIAKKQYVITVACPQDYNVNFVEVTL